MKIWLTARYDPKGIEEAEVTDDSTDANLIFLGDKLGQRSHNWFIEGVSWHRTKEAAVEAARQHRANWIKETTERAAEVAAFPSIAA